MNNEKLVNEAVNRMNILGIFKVTIDEFKTKGIINSSINGGLYWLEDKYLEIARKFEKDNNVLVYHVVLNRTEVGDLFSILYVSADEDEWVMEREYLRNNTAFAYVKNLNNDLFSEYGTIGIKQCFGGLIRTY